MANGTKYVMDPDFGHFTLIDGAVATTDGAWVDVGRYSKCSIHVDGITTATVTINGSNAQTIPADSANGDAIGSSITADGWVSLDPLPRWLKARVTVWSSGTVRVDVKAVD